MDVNRKGKQITIAFDTDEEAIGLYATLTGTTNQVSPEAATKGQWLYGWFFTSVQKLAFDFNNEQAVATQSPETMQGPTVVSSKRKRQ